MAGMDIFALRRLYKASVVHPSKHHNGLHIWNAQTLLHTLLAATDSADNSRQPPTSLKIMQHSICLTLTSVLKACSIHVKHWLTKHKHHNSRGLLPCAYLCLRGSKEESPGRSGQVETVHDSTDEDSLQVP